MISFAAGAVAAVAVLSLFGPARAPLPALAAASAAAAPLAAPLRLDPGRPLTWEERATQVERELEQEFGWRTFSFHRRPPYLLAVERVPGVHDDRAPWYERELTSLRDRFQRLLAAPLGLPEPQAVLPVLILADRASYEAYCRRVHGRPLPALVAGLYEISRRRIVMHHSVWDGPEILRHEGVHQLVHHYAGYGSDLSSTWFHEGLAALFESADDAPARLAVARAAMESGEAPALRELVGLRTRDVWSMLWDGGAKGAAGARHAQVGYALAVAFVRFLLEEHRPAFLTYVRCELAGEGGAEALREALKRESALDWPQVEAVFRSYMLGRP